MLDEESQNARKLAVILSLLNRLHARITIDLLIEAYARLGRSQFLGFFDLITAAVLSLVPSRRPCKFLVCNRGTWELW